MVKRKKKILLSSLIGLYCLGISFQIEAGRVYTAEELTASGGVVTIDATNGALGPDALGIRHNGSNEEKFIYYLMILKLRAQLWSRRLNYFI